MTTTETTTGAALDQLAINTIRTLSMDGVQKANSGHPGAPMALAPVTYVLYTRVMKHNPKNAEWFDRDRFVLSAGHASMLLYSMLHLSGYGLTIDDLEALPPVGQPDGRPPRVRGTLRASRPPPGRSGRASRTPWAWRWPRRCWPRATTATVTS